MNKKEELKRLKAWLLAVTLCLSLTACKKNNSKNTEKDNNNDNRAVVCFIQGKALIYDGNDDVDIRFDGRNGSLYLSSSLGLITEFSSGVEAIKTNNLEEAYNLAVAIVGEDNIIYIDYDDAKNMNLTYTKKKN